MKSFHFVIFILLLAVSTVVGQTIDSKKPLKSIFEPAKNETIVFVSGIMTVAEETYREVYVVNEGRTTRWPSTITQMVAYFKHPGKQKTAPNAVILAFNMGTYNNFRFTDFRDLVIKTDTENFEMGPMNLTERKNLGHGAFGTVQYWETLELPVRIEEYQRIINSKKVSMQIGEQVASLDEGQLKQLRDLANKHLK